jgi:DNA repair protein RadC
VTSYPADPAPLADPSVSDRPLRGLPPRIHRPREKLARFGPRALGNGELLAILLGSGTRSKNVLNLARDLVSRHGAARLAGFGLKEWSEQPGIGVAKASRLVAAFELGRRLLVPASDEPHVGSPAEAYALVRDLRLARREHLVALYLDSQNRLLRRETVSIGSLNTTRTHPREVLQPAVVHSALAFILVHNHPSGSLDPSQDDVAFTRAMSRAGELMGINLYDHLIVSRRGYVSLKERGLM